jgi:oligosaccharide repeat unit polymerase
MPLLRRELNLKLRGFINAIVAFILFRAALDFAYVNYVAKFAGRPFIFTGFNIPRMVGSYIISIIVAAFLIYTIYRKPYPSGIALLLYFVIVLIPLISLYSLADAPATFIFMCFLSFSILVAFYHVDFNFIKKIKIPNQNLVYFIIMIIVGVSFYVYGWQIYTGGIGRLNFNLNLVYEVRQNFSETHGFLMGYFLPWQGYIVNIAIFLWGFLKKKQWMIYISIAAQLLLFGMTGYKSFLLVPVLALGIYMIWEKSNMLSYVFIGAFFLIIISYVIFLGTGDHILPSIFIRRLFYVPASNHIIYFDYFSQPGHPFVMLSNSILSPFIKYPYDITLIKVIAFEYWGRDFNPNVGYLGDAFAHFGYIGMILFSMVLGIFLRFVDRVGNRLPRKFVAGLMAASSASLTNSALFTCLLTHGLIVALILMWILNYFITPRYSIILKNSHIYQQDIR